MKDQDAEMRELFERVLDAMALAGWLEAHRYTEGKGWHLVWSAEGYEKAGIMRLIAESFGLDRDDRAPVAFDKFCAGESPAGLGVAFAMERAQAGEAADFWREATDAFGIHDVDGLGALVAVLKGWADLPERPGGG